MFLLSESRSSTSGKALLLENFSLRRIPQVDLADSFYFNKPKCLSANRQRIAYIQPPAHRLYNSELNRQCIADSFGGLM